MSTPQQNKPGALVPPVVAAPGSELEQLQLEALRKQIALLDADLAGKARQNSLTELELNSKQRTEDEFQANLAQRRAMILSQAKDNELKRIAQTAAERNCPHLMENMKRATRGNINGSRKMMIVCQKCRKLWLENDQGNYMGYSSDTDKQIPGHLIPNDIEVGGFKGFTQH